MSAARTDYQRAAAVLRARPELAALLLAEPIPPGPEVVRGPDDLAAVFRPLLGGRETEALSVCALNRAGRVLDVAILTTGSAGYCIVDPPQILRWVLTRAAMATSFAVAHNHPSGDPHPSSQDVEVTRALLSAARAVRIQCLDHVIIGDGSRYSSLANLGHVPVQTWSPYV